MRRALILVAVAASVLLVAGCGKSAESVKVPSIGEANPGDAYSLLRKAGLRVSVSVDVAFAYNSTYSFGFKQRGYSVSQNPAPGTIVSSGSTVILTIGPAGNYGGWSYIPSTHCPQQPKAVPSLTGESLSSAVSAFSGCFNISTSLPPLHAAGAPQLLDNYVIEHQSPAAGSTFPEVSASNPPSDGPIALKVEVSAKN